MATQLKNLSDFSQTTIPNSSEYKFAIVVAEWNSQISNALLQGAYATLIENNCHKDNIEIVNVPGTFELSAAANLLASNNKFDAIICLGCVIQGETRHFDFICHAVANGLTNVSIKHNIPCIFGVLTTDNLQQAVDRSGGKHGNKGIEAAVTAIKMASLGKFHK